MSASRAGGGELSPDVIARLRAVAEARATSEPAHDFLHVLRVTASARGIGEKEGARLEVVVPAALLHELFNYPKGHPDSPRSGEVCAEHAREVLQGEGVARETVDAIATCIREHPFSRGILPDTIEGKVLQDADRLDAIGAIGIARCMATCAEMKRPFYSPVDPFCAERSPDDKAWGIDHFYAKLLRIPDVLHTPTARAMASERVAAMKQFLDQLAREI
ncbi:MAG: HD domain-containing protein [Polyangiaceae bacterium]